MTFLWIILAVLYITLWVTLGMRTLRKGHTALFLDRDHLPGALDLGALMEPTPAVAAAESRERLR